MVFESVIVPLQRNEPKVSGPELIALLTVDIRSEAANNESLGMWEELVVLSRCLRGVISGKRSEDVNQIAMPGLCSPRTRIRHLAVC